MVVEVVTVEPQLLPRQLLAAIHLVVEEVGVVVAVPVAAAVVVVVAPIPFCPEAVSASTRRLT